MHRSFSLLPGMIGAVALVLAGSTVDLHAQRGGGAGAGNGRPVTAGAQGHGRPDNPGAQGQTHRPTTPGETAGRDGHEPDTDKSKKGDHATTTTGRPTVSDQLTRNTNLLSRLQTLFPKDTDLSKEAGEFRTLGQFVAAAHVAHNHPNITFDDLKAKMTGEHPVSLGQAIHELDPNADATTEAKTAEKEADTDIKDSTKTKPTTAS
jgi:hypothetical protein